MKFAVTLFGASIVIDVGLMLCVMLPDQFEKVYPVLAVAERGIFCPLLCQFAPPGLTDPLPPGLTDVLREYWVVKLAV